MSDKPKEPDPRRTEAETQITRKPIKLVNPQPGEELLHKLLHELQVHQVELEMQNEELRQAQIAMEESRDRYVDLYDFAPIGFITLSREGVISEINLTASDMLAVVRKKLLARRFSQFVAEEERDRWYRHFTSVLQHDQRQRCELAFQREDGTRFHAQLDSLRMGDCRSADALEKASDPHVKAGGACTVHIALTDISERMQAEAAIQEAREFAESIVDTVCNPLIVLDAELKVVSVNRAYCQFFHVSPENCVGRRLHELGARQWDNPQLMEALKSILPQSRAIEGFEVEHDFPVIGKRKLLLDARRIIGKTKGTQSILLAMEDVSERG